MYKTCFVAYPLVYALRALERDVYPTVVGHNVLYLSIRSNRPIVLFKFSISSLSFLLGDLLLKGAILKSSYYCRAFSSQHSVSVGAHMSVIVMSSL